MRPRDTYVSRDERFSLGIDEDSGTPYLSFPVSSAAADYEEFYRLTGAQYEDFLASPARALPFLASARRRQRDDLLLQRPGWNRGTPMGPLPPAG